MVSFVIKKVFRAMLFDACVVGTVYAYKKYKKINFKIKNVNDLRDVYFDNINEKAKNKIADEKKRFYCKWKMRF